MNLNINVTASGQLCSALGHPTEVISAWWPRALLCPKRPAIATPAVRDGVSELVDSMGSDTPSPPTVTLLPWQPATSGHNQPFSMWAFIQQPYTRPT